MSDDYCAVCAEPLAWAAVGPCGHREVCHKCSARLRLVCADNRCALCKTVRASRSHVVVPRALAARPRVLEAEALRWHTLAPPPGV